MQILNSSALQMLRLTTDRNSSRFVSPIVLSFSKQVCDFQWVTVGDVDVDIGANPSAEEEEEGVDSTARKVVDVVDAFRLNVSTGTQYVPPHTCIISRRFVPT